MKVVCPKCNSDQLTADKKGFSGGKAVAGALLTGGIGLLAGTIGSSKVIITCLACGNRFKAGEGKQIKEENFSAQASSNVSEVASTEEEAMSLYEPQILEIIKTKGLLAAVVEVKNLTGMELKDAKNYVDGLKLKHQVPTPKGGCAGIVILIISGLSTLYALLS